MCHTRQSGEQTVLNLNIMHLEVANGTHNGVVRVHLGTYINQRAQTWFSQLADVNADVHGITLLPDSQIVIVEASKPTDDADELKVLTRGVIRAIGTWYDELDELDRNLFGVRPNIAREVQNSYSAVGAFHSYE